MAIEWTRAGAARSPLALVHGYLARSAGRCCSCSWRCLSLFLMTCSTLADSCGVPASGFGLDLAALTFLVGAPGATVSCAQKVGHKLGDRMAQATTHDQKEQAAAWDRQCWKVQLKYAAFVLPPAFVLMLPFFLTLYYFLDVAGPLVSGELAYGQPGYYEYQAEKDRYLILLAVLFVLNVALYFISFRWYKKMMRALGPRPGGYPGKWKRWLGAV